jgi:acyl-CoA thioesterase I
MGLCFFGDSFVNGTGDDSGLGWVGRIVAHGRSQGRDLTAYNLGVRRDTSEDIASRWVAEARRRFAPDTERGLLFSFGANDCTPDGATCRVPLERAIPATSAVLRQAVALAPTIVVGPIPILDDDDTDRRISELGLAQEALCGELRIPFLPVERFVQTCAPWRAEARAGDGSHPNREGYAAFAQFLLNWRGMRDWLRLT